MALTRARADLAPLRSASSPEMIRMEGKRLRDAASIIADRAKEIAATFSKKIPPTIKIAGGTGGLEITAGGPDGQVAPNAYMFETKGARHMTFGHRDAPWHDQPYRPFLEEAAAQTIDKASEAYAKVIDDWTRELGW